MMARIEKINSFKLTYFINFININFHNKICINRLMEFIAYNYNLDIFHDQINTTYFISSSCTHCIFGWIQPANYICMCSI